MAKTIQSERDKIDKLVTQSNRQILSVNSVFPFDFFPDTIHVDENKVQIIHRPFFFEEQIFPILYPAITAIKVHNGVLFSSIKFELKGFETNPQPVNLLTQSDALLLKRIVLGLVICAKEKVDLSKLSVSEIRKKAESIGKTRENI